MATAWRHAQGNRDPQSTWKALRFDKLNAFVNSRNGWITSIPGAAEVSIECLPGSELPDELRERGYELEESGEGQRILPAGIVETFITEGSTVPRTVTHAGIVRVLRFGFSL